MYHKHFQKAARTAAAAFREAAKKSSEMGSAKGVGSAALKQAATNAGRSGAAAQSPAMQAFKQHCSQLSAVRPASGMTFASAPITHPPMPIGNTTVQVRHASSTDLSEDGDGEDAVSHSTSSNGRSKSPVGKSNSDDEDETPGKKKRRLDPGGGGTPGPPGQQLAAGEEGDSGEEEGAGASRSLLDLVAGGGTKPRFARRPGGNQREYETLDNQDPLALLVSVKESFMRKDERTLPIPPSVRQVLYQHNWDKLLVDVRRYVKVKARGKEETYVAMVAVGNGKGLFGLGIGEAKTAQMCVAQAYMKSFQSLVAVPLYRGHTLYHHVEHSLHHLKMLLMPRPDGWGLRGSDLMAELCALAGLRNASVRVIGRRKNKFYVAQCFMEALQKQSTPYDGVEGTGMYMREVWHHPKLPAGLRRGVDIDAAPAAKQQPQAAASSA